MSHPVWSHVPSGSLCPEEGLSGGGVEGSLSSRCVSVKGVSVKGVSVQAGLCPPCVWWTSRQYAFYWNSFLFITTKLNFETFNENKLLAANFNENFMQK